MQQEAYMRGVDDWEDTIITEQQRKMMKAMYEVSGQRNTDGEQFVYHLKCTSFRHSGIFFQFHM